MQGIYCVGADHNVSLKPFQQYYQDMIYNHCKEKLLIAQAKSSSFACSPW